MSENKQYENEYKVQAVKATPHNCQTSKNMI